MKTLKFTNENKSLDVEYLVDLNGDDDMISVYQITQYVDGVKQVNLNGMAQSFGMPDDIDQTVHNDNSRTKYTLVGFTDFAKSKNLTLEVFEGKLAPVKVNTLTALSITTSTLAGGTENTAYSEDMVATGGSAPYIWETASTLPDGITLSTGGKLAGTPIETGTFGVVLKVTDKFGVTTTAASINLVIS